jgi:hypothetical protein
MDSFALAARGQTQTFRLDVDYAEGETRFHWTLAGLEKLISLGLWARQFDKKGNLTRKPPNVEAAIAASIAQLQKVS